MNTIVFQIILQINIRFHRHNSKSLQFSFQKKKLIIESNLKNLNGKGFDLDFEVDPLFKKMSAQFDEGRSTSGPFLTSLQFLVSGQILFIWITCQGINPILVYNETKAAYLVKSLMGVYFLGICCHIFIIKWILTHSIKIIYLSTS